MIKMNKLSRTEEKIRDVLIEMIDEMPINAIRVKDLAKRAHIDRSTFYVYYDSIYDVLQQIEDEYFDGLVAGKRWGDRYLNEPAPETVKNINYAKRNVNILRTLLGPHGDSTFQARMAKILRQSYQGATRGSPHSDIYYRMIQEFFVGGQQNMLRFWVSHITDISPEEMAILLHRLFDKLYKCLLDGRP